MSKSEIFDNFVKIAQEKGMISKDAPEKAKKILDKTHRADSLDISAIEALYGVKPDLPKDMEYKRNIIEDAHPNAAIVSPSYDKLNGLVENNNERQDILLNIVNRTPNGHGNLHKNATKNLVLSLVRVGNELDIKRADKLRVLADTCLAQVSLKKQAILPLAIGVAAAIGALYAQQHMSFSNEGFQQNHNKLIAEIDDLLNSNSDWGVGSQYTPEFHNMVQQLKDKLNNFYALYQRVYPLISNLEKPQTAKDLLQIAQQPQTDSVVKAYQMLRAAFEDMVPYLDTVKNDFSSETFKAQQTQDKGILTSLVDKMQVFHGGKGLISDDFDDVVRAFAPYQQSVADILDILRKAQSIQQSAQAQISQAVSENQKNLGPEMGVSTPTATTPTTNSPDEFGTADLENDLATGGLG